MADASFYLEELVATHHLEGFKDVFWNLGQVVAWAETRSPFPVDALSDSTKDLARRDHSMPPGLPHYAAKFADRCADVNGLARIKSPFQSIDDVRRAVLRSFQSGSLTASGQRRGTFEREPMTSLEWADLTIDDSLTGEMIVRHRDGMVAAWNDVRVKREDVISAFPMPATLTEDARTDDDDAFISPAQEAKATLVSFSTKAVGGRGKMRRSIQAAFKELWPSGEIPIGMSSQDRNDKILAQLTLEKYGLRTKPDKRTIERALKLLNK